MGRMKTGVTIKTRNSLLVLPTPSNKKSTPKPAPKCPSLVGPICELHNVFPDRFPQFCHGPIKCFGKGWKTYLKDIQPSGVPSVWSLLKKTEDIEDIDIELEDVEVEIEIERQ